MSEKGLQKALIHLFANVDLYPSYSEADFDGFELSGSEKQSLEELMAGQLPGLLLFREQLQSKRRRAILDALPISRAIAGGQLATVLDTHMSHLPHGTACDSPEAVRAFANDLRVQTGRITAVSRELEFILFEAVCVSVSRALSAARPETPRPARPPSGLRLSCDGDAALLSCTYDVCAAMKNGSLRRLSDYPSNPGSLFLFRSSGGDLQILAVASELAKVLGLFLGGLSLGQVVHRFESEAEKTAALVSVERLLTLGAPFYIG